MSTTSIDQQTITAGPLETFYKDFKRYLPSRYNYSIIKTIDNKIAFVTKECDKLIKTTFETTKNLKQNIPSTKDAQIYIVSKSQKHLLKIEKFLDDVVQFLGGKVNNVNNSQNCGNRLLTIFQKYIQINSLFVKSIFEKAIKYTKNPYVLTNQVKELTRSIYIRFNALIITLKSLMADTINQVLQKLNIQCIQTKKYFKLILKDLKNSDRINEILTQKFINLKKILIRTWKNCIEIAVDKKHYHQNVNKIVSHVIRSVGQVLMNLQDKYDNAIYNAKQLYQKTVRNYKIQKILLQTKKEQAPYIIKQQQQSNAPIINNNISNQIVTQRQLEQEQIRLIVSQQQGKEQTNNQNNDEGQQNSQNNQKQTDYDNEQSNNNQNEKQQNNSDQEDSKQQDQ